MTGVQLIAAERTRQIEGEKWTSEHDDGHRRGELASAGACYAMAASVHSSHHANASEISPPRQWLFESEAWKPVANPIRNLVKAGALIAAEIDRLQRKANRPPRCPECNTRMEYEDDRDEAGKLLNAWWHCPACSRNEPLSAKTASGGEAA
jgi:hypothetical protein